MDNSWICEECGGKSSHFNSSRGCLVCDICGAEVRSKDELNANIVFQKDMALARQHLKVGNWDEAKRIVKPYENSRPAEKQVYLYLLVATTKCFEDFLLDDPVADSEAAKYYDKLKRLGCVNSAMINYAKRRSERIKTIKNDLSRKRLIIIVINAIINIVTLILLAYGEEISVLFVILSVVGWVHSSRWLRTIKKKSK